MYVFFFFSPKVCPSEADAAADPAAAAAVAAAAARKGKKRVEPGLLNSRFLSVFFGV